jgi:hypothetical protein
LFPGVDPPSVQGGVPSARDSGDGHHEDLGHCELVSTHELDGCLEAHEGSRRVVFPS